MKTTGTDEKPIERYITTLKQYILPLLVILGILFFKLYIVGALKPIYTFIMNKPIYVEKTTMEWWKAVLLLLTDIIVGFNYVWVKNITGEDTEEQEIEKSTALSTFKKTFKGDGFTRGYTYLWFSALSTILLTILWSIVTMMTTYFFSDLVVSHPELFLQLYLLLGGLRLAIMGIFNQGLLTYAVYATDKKNNLFRAMSFTVQNLFKLIWIRIKFYTSVLFGLILLVIGSLFTTTDALRKQSISQRKLVREYEREALYKEVGRRI